MLVRIYENLRTLSYAPCYLADSLDLFKEQGLTAEVTKSPRPAETAEGLLAGRVDVSWGGPMRVMLHHDQDPECALVCFGAVVGPEPFSFVGAKPRPDFAWKDLYGLRVGVMDEVPTPWHLLQEDLRRAGLDPATFKAAPSRTMAENVAALAAGEVDVIQVMEPYTEDAIRRGGHVWHPQATRGDVTFTSFYCPRPFFEGNPDICHALCRALEAALHLVRTGDPMELASMIHDRFSEWDKSHIANGIARYQALGIWPQTTRLPEAGFVRLKGALLSGGFIRRDIPFDVAVDNRYSPAT